MKFRTDINGLRAYAVIAVIIFHFNKQWLPGGFAGVDVFFVISGYLMTSIIFRGLENKNFSIWKFYAARIKRIVPALLFLIIILMIFGYLFLAPTFYSSLAKHSGSALLFFSNIMYWREAGYFDSSAIEKYLLHTWSLSIEWQFYIIYPVVLLILARFFKLDTLKKIIIVGTVLTLIFSIYASQKWTVAAYFLLPTRMWEMLIGGVAFLYPFDLKKQYEKNFLELSGLVLIIVSFFIITENTIWPGYAALIPTLGAFILLQANNDKSIFTNNIICQKLGLWSYSLYLWHWSLLAIYNHFRYKIKIWPFLFVTLACGITSYYLIEKRKWNIWLVIVLGFIVLSSTSYIYLSKGSMNRSLEDKIKVANFEKNNKNPFKCMDFGECILGNPDNIGAILVGDSHADSLASALADYQQLYNQGLLVYTRASCPFILNARVKGEANTEVCIEDNKRRLEEIKKHPNLPVIIAARWSVYLYGQNAKERKNSENTGNLLFFNEYYSSNNPLLEFEQNLSNTLCEVSNNRNNVYIVQPIPEMLSNIPDTQIKNILQNKNIPTFISISEYSKRSAKVRDVIQKVGDKCNVRVLDPTKFLCDSEKCNGLHNGRPIYYDSDHLSEFGNKLLVPMFHHLNMQKN